MIILINFLRELVNLNKIDKFGPSSEKTSTINIFNEAERTSETSKDETKDENKKEEQKCPDC